MLVFGHRGAPGFPRYGENTIASFEMALAAGADGLEFDVRRCADGQIVVIHDDTIDRTTNGSGRVASLTYEELSRFNAGHGDRIPLLSEVLDRFGRRCILNIEIKDSGIAEDIKKLVLDRAIASNVIVSCFEWIELKPLSGSVPIALLSSDPHNLIASAIAMGAVAIHPRRDIARPLIRPAHDSKLRVHIFTVNDPSEAAILRDLQADAIFTDFPERCTTPAS